MRKNHFAHIRINLIIMLTESQKNKIFNLPQEDLICIMHICADALGLLDVEEGAEVMEIAKRTLYQRMHDEKVGSFTIGRHVFPLVNVFKRDE